MSSRQRKGKVITATKPQKQATSLQGVAGADSSNDTRGNTSSMDTIRIQPRTPRQGTHDTQEVELSLLEENEQRQAAVGFPDDDDFTGASRLKRPMSTRDKRSMGLLIVLCEFHCRRRVNATNLS